MPRINTATHAFPLLPRNLADEYEQLRVDRLRELRAVIDVLRAEQEARDPLLAWVLDSNRPGS